jgi:hypothetical protein
VIAASWPVSLGMSTRFSSSEASESAVTVADVG